MSQLRPPPFQRVSFPPALGLAVLLAGLPCGPALARQARPDTGQAAAGWTVASPFRALDLPAPTTIRTGAGRPGPDYWQQEADYRIRATLDTASKRLTGSERIHYVNHSPADLSYLWLQLDGNICAPGSVNQLLDQPPLRFGEGVFDYGCRDGGGVQLTRVASGGRDLEHRVDGTMMRVDLSAPVPSGGSVDLDVDWSWKIPEYGNGRMGRDGSLYEVAEWYPRMAVYDDVKGWNTDPFIGAGEFYLEYGSFDVSLTLPAGYLVAATGTLQNPADVLTRAQRERLDRARSSASPVAVVTASEAKSNATRRVAGAKTWSFHADSVRDFAFAAAPNYRWDASDWQGILIETLYRPEAKPWEESNRMARATISYFSERLGRYPWPHATTVEGPIEGMEYPMLTFVPSYESEQDQFWVLTHEFGHEWFPMLVGSNERLYPWMDEGFNTFIDLGSMENYFRRRTPADTIAGHPLNEYARHALPGQEQPISERPVEQHDLFWTAYQKPALMMHLLRTEILGKERFDRAFADYVRTWRFKHPTPADFFRRMADAAGVDLDWFWREWIYGTARLDQAIVSVSNPDSGRPSVTIRSVGDMVMPAELRVGYADGSGETVDLPVDMWNLGPVFTWRGPTGKRISSAELDPRHVFPDTDRTNDGWRANASSP